MAACCVVLTVKAGLSRKSESRIVEENCDTDVDSARKAIMAASSDVCLAVRTDSLKADTGPLFAYRMIETCGRSRKYVFISSQMEATAEVPDAAWSVVVSRMTSAVSVTALVNQ